MIKYYKHKKYYDRAQHTTNSFDKLYRKCLQDNVIVKKEYECSCNIFTHYQQSITIHHLNECKMSNNLVAPALRPIQFLNSLFNLFCK